MALARIDSTLSNLDAPIAQDVLVQARAFGGVLQRLGAGGFI